MIKYIIDSKLYDEEYVVDYTDASLLVGEGSISRTGSSPDTMPRSGPTTRARDLADGRQRGAKRT